MSNFSETPQSRKNMQRNRDFWQEQKEKWGTELLHKEMMSLSKRIVPVPSQTNKPSGYPQQHLVMPVSKPSD